MYTTEECRRLGMRLDAANMRPRNAGRTLLTLAGVKLDLRTELDGDQAVATSAVSEMLAECEHWKQCWVHEHVDKDHKVREALANSADCEFHGRVIKDLEAQVAHFDRAHDKAESARLALLALLTMLTDSVDQYDRAVKCGDPVADGPAIMAKLRTAVTKTRDAHHRVWSN